MILQRLGGTRRCDQAARGLERGSPISAELCERVWKPDAGRQVLTFAFERDPFALKSQLASLTLDLNPQ